MSSFQDALWRRRQNENFDMIEVENNNRIKEIANVMKRISNLILNKSDLPEITDARQDAEGNIHPVLKDRLDSEYNKLLSKIKKTIYVTDFGAVGDGVADDTEAFKKALGNGKVRVVVILHEDTPTS